MSSIPKEPDIINTPAVMISRTPEDKNSVRASMVHYTVIDRVESAYHIDQSIN